MAAGGGPPCFFVSADFKGLRSRVFVSADSKGLRQPVLASAENKRLTGEKMEVGKGITFSREIG